MFDIKTVKKEAMALYKENRGKSVLPFLVIICLIGFMVVFIACLMQAAMGPDYSKSLFFCVYFTSMAVYSLGLMLFFPAAMVFYYKIKKGTCTGFKDFWKSIKIKPIGLGWYVMFRLLGWWFLCTIPIVSAQVFSILARKNEQVVLYSILSMLCFFIAMIPYVFYIQKAIAYACSFLAYADTPDRKITEIF